MPARQSVRHLTAAMLLLSCTVLAGCGVVRPGMPGHEPAGDGPYNPVSREDNEGK